MFCDTPRIIWNCHEVDGIVMRHRKINDTLPDTLFDAFRIFGNDISAARRARHMTQESLANRINTSRQTVIHMEQGDPRVSMSAYAAAAWIMRLENNLLNAFAQENDPIQQREGRIGLPKRIVHSRTNRTAKPKPANDNDITMNGQTDIENAAHTETAAHTDGLDF